MTDREKKKNKSYNASKNKLKDLIDGTVSHIEQLLWFELALGVYWTIMLVVIYFTALRELLPLIVSSLHVASPLAAILCLEFFIYEDKHMTRFTNLVWQVPTVITLVADISLLFLAISNAFLPAWNGHIEEGGAPLYVAVSLVILLALLTLSSLLMSTHFIIINQHRLKLKNIRHKKSQQGYDNV